VRVLRGEESKHTRLHVVFPSLMLTQIGWRCCVVSEDGCWCRGTEMSFQSLLLVRVLLVSWHDGVDGVWSLSSKLIVEQNLLH